MNGPAIPWEIIAPHEKQALYNHDQTLQRLAERGGLCSQEALATLNDEPLFPYFQKLKEQGINDAQAAKLLEEYVKEHWYLPRITELEARAVKAEKERDHWLERALACGEKYEALKRQLTVREP